MESLNLDRFVHVPRKVRLQSRTLRMRVGLWLAAFLLLVVVPIIGFTKISRLRQLQSSGIVKQADVVEKHSGSGRSSSTTMTVSFQVDGRTVTEARQVSKVVVQRYWYQPTVPVTLMPGHPDDWEIGVIDDAAISEQLTLWEVLVGLWGGIVLAFLIALEICTALERRLVSLGTVVLGTVVSAKYLPKQGTRTTYSFRTMNGEKTNSSAAAGNVVEKYQPGTQLVVFYRNDENPESKPFGFFQYVELTN